MQSEKFPLVFAGHVDHGKSTIIGRLLSETGSLPEGKLEAIKNYCRLNSRPFEYAFLIDALKDEQSQGITIDTPSRHMICIHFGKILMAIVVAKIRLIIQKSTKSNSKILLSLTISSFFKSNGEVITENLEKSSQLVEF